MNAPSTVLQSSNTGKKSFQKLFVDLNITTIYKQNVLEWKTTFGNTQV